MGAIDGVQIDQQHRICIDNISLEEVDAADAPPVPSIPTVTPGTEMLTNGNFANGEQGWIKAITAPGAGEISFADNKAIIDVKNTGDADWNVQLKQSGITLESGCDYTLKFRAESSVSRKIKCAFLDDKYDWYGGDDVIIDTVDAEGFVKDVTLNFSVASDKPSNDQITFVISMGKMEGEETPLSKIKLSDFSLMKNVK